MILPFRRFNFLAPWRTGLGVRSAKISFFHIPRGKDSFPSFPCDFQKVVRRRDTVHSFTIRRVSLYLYSWTRNFASLAWPKTSSRRLRWPTLVWCWWKKEEKRKRTNELECVGRLWNWMCIIFFRIYVSSLSVANKNFLFLLLFFILCEKEKDRKYIEQVFKFWKIISNKWRWYFENNILIFNICDK